VQLALLAVIPSVLATSILSGIFGMGGGMLLMGVMAGLLPVDAAMILHGTTQLAANGSRALFLRRHACGRVLGWLALGAAAGAAAMIGLAVRADRATVLVVLGAVPLVVALLPRRWMPSVSSPAVAVACGAVVISTQLLAGASGPLLDVFFVNAGLNRYQVVATKAAFQSVGHALKIVYYGVLVGSGARMLPLWAYPAVVIVAVIGTRLGHRVLKRLPEAGFRRWSTRLVVAIATVFLVRGIAA